MSLALELKRRLDFEDAPLKKRLKLAENALFYPLLTISNKEDVIIQWLCEKLNCLSNVDKDNLFNSLNNFIKDVNFKTCSLETKSKFLNILSKCLENCNEEIQTNNAEKSFNYSLLECCIITLDNSTIYNSYHDFINNYFVLVKEFINNVEMRHKFNLHCVEQKKKSHETLLKLCLNSLQNFIKSINKKIILVEPFLETQLLWKIMSLHNNVTLSNQTLNICQLIIFPHYSLTLFKKYIIAYNTEGDIKKLIEENGENLKPIVTIVNLIMKISDFFQSDIVRFNNFIKLFVYSSKSDDTLLYLMFLILYKSLGVEYVNSNESKVLLTENFNRDIVKSIHLEILQLLIKYNININKCAIDNSTSNNKQLLQFIQEVTSNIVFENLDCLSLSIIKQAFLLDPIVLEPVLYEILAFILVQKKSDELFELYNDTLVTIVEIIFKMSRGLEFMTQLIPKLKDSLEECNKEQQKFIQKLKNNLENIEKIEKINNKILVSRDIFPEKFCNIFGVLSSDLVSWQHTNLMKVLVNFINEYCITALEDDTLNPSVVTICELLCSLLVSFFQHSKIADEDIPEAIYHKFDEVFKYVGSTLLIKLGENILKYPEEIRLLRLFLNLCLNYGHMKLLLSRYQPHYHENDLEDDDSENNGFHVFNLSLLDRNMSFNNWKKIYKLIVKSNDKISNELMYNLIMQNCVDSIIHKNRLKDSNIIYENTKSYILENFNNISPLLFKNDMYMNIFINKLKPNEIKNIANKIVFIIASLETENNQDNLNSFYSLFKINCIDCKKDLLYNILIELLRKIWKTFDKKNITKHYFSLYDASNNDDFNIKESLKTVSNSKEYFDKLIECDVSNNLEDIKLIIDIINKLPLQFLNENISNKVLFTVTLLLFKNGDETLNQICKSVLMKLFEVSFKLPNLIDLFPASFLLDLIKNDIFKLTLKSNDVNFNKYDLLKNILLGIVLKENVNGIENVTDVLVNDLNESEDSLSYFKNESFQMLSLLLMVLSNVKKSNMSSEMKTSVSSCCNKATEILYNYIKNLDWISEIENLDSNEDIKSSSMIFMESYSILILQHNKPNDSKKLKKICKALNFFLKLAFETCIKNDLDLFNVKGSCRLINVVLNNYKILSPHLSSNNQQTLFSQVWSVSKVFLENNMKKIEPAWNEVTKEVLENITLTCELSDTKFFNSHLVKELIGSKNIEDDMFSCMSTETSHVMQKLWYCFLNANLKVTGKNEARSSIVKQLTKKFYFWLKNINNNSVNFNIKKGQSEDQKNNKAIEKFEITQVYIDVITEFVNTKKMILSNYLIDIIIQIPMMISLDHQKEYSLIPLDPIDIYCILFDKCSKLLNALLLYRSELLQDRWPCFFFTFRKLIESLCLKSNSDIQIGNENLSKLVKLSHMIERITQTMVKNVKQDITRIAPYLISDIIAYFQKVSVHKPVKFHLQNCINYLMQLLDNHARSFLMRNMTDSSSIMFQKINEVYNKYHKYVGTS